MDIFPKPCKRFSDVILLLIPLHFSSLLSSASALCIVLRRPSLFASVLPFFFYSGLSCFPPVLSRASLPCLPLYFLVASIAAFACSILYCLLDPPPSASPLPLYFYCRLSVFPLVLSRASDLRLPLYFLSAYIDAFSFPSCIVSGIQLMSAS